MSSQEVFAELGQRLAQKPASALASAQGVYQFSLNGNDAAEYYIAVTGEGATVHEGKTDAAGVTISMTADNFKELAAGRLNPMSAFMGGKLTVTGDMSMALKLQTLIS
ncbi:MAG: SCP2 sterol-binding domain-containing protein [Sulfobacillus sp.]